MKNLKIKLTAAVFIFAVAGAFASKRLSTEAYTRKVDIPSQSQTCQDRGTCDGTSGTCSATFGTITANLYNSACSATLSGAFTSN